jgi:hypothetical protein
MNITPEIEETIDSLIDRWIPDGQDRYLHINPRIYMKDIVIQLLEKNAIPPKMILVNSLIRNWRVYLHKRFGDLN